MYSCLTMRMDGYTCRNKGKTPVFLVAAMRHTKKTATTIINVGLNNITLKRRKQLKITIDRDNLARITTRANEVSGNKNSPLPILAYVLIEGDGGIIKITATNLEEILNISVDGVVDSEGKVCIPIARLKDIAHACDKGNILIETAENQVKIEAGGASYALNTLPAENYPDTSEADKEAKTFTIQGTALAGLISNVSFAVSRDINKEGLTAIALHGCGKTLKAVGCDGHRLALEKVESECFEGFKLIPLPAAKKIAQIADKAGDQLVSISLGEKFISVSQGDTKYRARLVDNAYPDYEAVLDNAIKGAVTSKANIEKTKLMSSLRLSSVVNDKETTALTLKFDSKNPLGIFAANSNVGDAATEVEVSEFSGTPLTMKFNGSYLLEGISSLPGDAVSMSFGDNGLSPVILRPKDTEYPVQIIMPIRK